MKIFSTIESWIRKWYLIEDRTFGTQRSPEWQRLRNDFVKVNNTCSACGTKNNLEVHHVLPFHINPELELDWNNLITLCDDCHWLFGHCKLNWKCYNPNVTEDIKIINKMQSNAKFEK